MKQERTNINKDLAEIAATLAKNRGGPWKWWYREVRKVVRKHYAPEYIRQGAMSHVTELLG